MKKPRFSEGTKVFHVSKQTYGVIKLSWFDGEQYRYEVQHSGWLWGVPDEALRPITGQRSFLIPKSNEKSE